MDKLDEQLQCSINGDFEGGWKLVQELEKERPNCNRCAFNRGWYVLRNGDLHNGMELISRGRWEKVFGSPPIKTNKPIFNIKEHDIKDKFILLNLEGGYGDEIIGSRFANEIYKMGGRPIIACHPNLMFLFSQLEGVSAVVCSAAAGDTYHDYWIPAMSAEYIMNYSFDTLPNKPYIKSHPYFTEKFSHIIKSNKPKIGLRWVGNPEFEHQQHRLFPEELFFNTFDDIRDKVELYSLQKDLDHRPPSYINDLDPYLKNWEDTAGAIENLDIVVSSCTSVAHLAASMGKLTYIIIPVLPYYIWAYELSKDEYGGEFTSYYKCVRLFRQKKFGHWEEPMIELKNALNKMFL